MTTDSPIQSGEITILTLSEYHTRTNDGKLTMISFASLSPITTSVVFHIVFVKILSNHFLDAVLDHLIRNMRMTHHNPHFP